MGRDKAKMWRFVANFCIVFMLCGMFALAFGYNTKFAFNEQKSKVYYKGNENNNNVSLMFNVYWGNEYIDGILDVLDKYNVKATFFIGGMWAAKNNDILKKIHSKGHEIANHGYFHKDQDKLDYKGNYNEIEASNRVIEGIIGVSPTLFAPPSGAFSNDTIRASEDLGMRTIMWSKDTIDWRDKNTDVIIKRATSNIQNGDLILAHPTKNTLDALDNILKYYRENGFNQVIVSKCIAN